MTDGREFARRAASFREVFLAALPRCQAAQGDLLQGIIERNAATEFGRQHGLAGLRGSDAFRKAVPLRTYDELLPWLTRVYAGQPEVLTMDPPAYFVLSSGTTADAKKLPLTRNRLITELQPCWLLRMATPILMSPGMAERADFAVNLLLGPPSAARGFSPSGVPERLFSELPWLADHSALRGMPGTQTPWFFSADPGSFEQRAYYTLRLAVEHDVRAFMGMNPLVMLAYARHLREATPQIIADVHDGTMHGRPTGRAANPKRARTLEALAQAAGGLLPRDVWSVELINCWNPLTGMAFVQEVQELFGTTNFLPGPYAASEAVVAIPIDNQPGAPLAILNAFFEFLPEGSDGPDTLLAHQLEVGHCYEVVVTQSSGLYRYRLGDLIYVEDFAGSVPRIRVAGRKGTFSFDVEKLTDVQLLIAGERALAECHVTPMAFCCVPIPDKPPRYDFVIELAAPPPADELTRLAAHIDQQLRELNFLYDLSRQRSAIAGIGVAVVAPGTLRRVRELQGMARGPSLQATKDRVLDPEGLTWLTKLRRRTD